MGPYLGDYIEDDTLHFLWSSNNSNGASVTRTVNGTISVYKDNGVAQSVAGITDTEDFDALTGIHSCSIDISAGALGTAQFDAAFLTAALIAADAIGASELAADAVTEIQAGLATAAALATVQADTDDIQTRLPAALVGGRMDSSVGAMAAPVFPP